jgi:TatD DNase family protein
MLVDSHCHLDFPDFEAERDAIVARAHAAGVGTLVTISTRVKKYDIYKTIAEKYDNVFFTIGTHPHQADEELGIPASEIIALSAHPKCIGIGEAGLDYFYKNALPQNQELGFRTHIEVARKTGLPLIIHAREADEDCAKILIQEMKKGEFKAVMHCFTASEALARTALDLGLYISFSGVVTYKTAQNLRDIASWLPKNRILVETDAPFLAPLKNRGKRNEPSFVADTARVVAEARGENFEEFAMQTSENFFHYFTKATRP